MNTVQILPERLAVLNSLELDQQSHESFQGGHCAMEVVSWLTNGPFTDHPGCVSPIIADTIIAMNDAISSKEIRTKLLLPLLLRTVGTKDSELQENQRIETIVDWQLRQLVPMLLDCYEDDSSAQLFKSSAPFKWNTQSIAEWQCRLRHIISYPSLMQKEHGYNCIGTHFDIYNFVVSMTDGVIMDQIDPDDPIVDLLDSICSVLDRNKQNNFKSEILDKKFYQFFFQSFPELIDSLVLLEKT